MILDAVFKLIGFIFKKIFEFFKLITDSITGRISVSNKMLKETRIGERKIKKFNLDKKRRLKLCDEI